MQVFIIQKRKKMEVLSSKNDPTWRLSMLEPCKMVVNMIVLSWASVVFLDGGTARLLTIE
jgi:hypothetical protein